jgi:glycosyltransferase involved in cell wall biosynthesis
MNPKVSVIVSTYNGERYVKETIASLLAQTFVDLELIVSDDGSTDRTNAILRSFKDKRLIVVESDQNRGIAESQNRAISLARGEYIALQDHDDLSLPDRLGHQLAFLEGHRGISLVGSGCIVIDEEGMPTGEWTVPVSDIDLKWSLLIHNPFLHTSLMIKRQALEGLAGYSRDVSFSYAEDYEFLSRFAMTYAVANIPEPLVKWRQHRSQASSRHIHTQEQSAMNIALRNMTSLLESKDLGPSLWFALKKLLLAKDREPVTVCQDEVYNVEHHITALQAAFYQKYSFSSPVVNEHRKKLSRLLGRHFVGLACKRNKGIDLSCRSALLSSGTRFLLQTTQTPSAGCWLRLVGQRILLMS